MLDFPYLQTFAYLCSRFSNTIKQRLLTKWFVSPEDMWWCLGTHVTLETTTPCVVPRAATTVSPNVCKAEAWEMCSKASPRCSLGILWFSLSRAGMAFVSYNSQKGSTSPPTFYSGVLEHFLAPAHELALSRMLENWYNSIFLGSLTLKSNGEPELCPSVNFPRILALFLWKRW